MTSLRLTVPVFALALLYACSSSAPSATPPATSTDGGAIDGESVGETGADAGAPAIPDTPAGRRFTWVLGAINGASTSDSDIKSNVSPDFLAAVSPQQLRSVFTEMAKTKPWTLVRFEVPPTASEIHAVITDKDAGFARVELDTDSAQSDKISGLLFQPAGDLDPTLASWSQVDDAIAKVAPNATLFAADLDQACAPIHAQKSDARFALGSAFKLYVLAELARQIDANQRSFSDKIAIDDALKSLPSGELQDETVGTQLTVKTFAEKMISISDNTATDHLLATLGRTNVEAMVTSSGHHAPADLRPFISTRELFTLKLMLSSAEQDAYVAASESEKRTLLTSYASRDPRTAAVAWTTPKRIDELEWFASGEDLCKLALVLKGYMQKPTTKPIGDILAINPGLADGAGAFSYIGYKGGSEPGVFVMSWIVRRKSDAGWRFLSVAYNDTNAPIDETLAAYVAGAARALLAQ